MFRLLNSVPCRQVCFCILIALLAAVFCPSPALAQQADLSALALNAAANFQPNSAEQVDAAFIRLVQDAESVDRWMANNGSYGYEYRDYLEWDAAQEQLAAENPNLVQLDKTLRLLTTDKKGLEQDRFRNVAKSLSNYIELVLISRDPNFSKKLSKRLERLVDRLERFQTKPSTWLEGVIGWEVENLDRQGAAPALVSAIRNRNSRPNVYADASASLLTAAVSEPFHQVGDVRDCILGTSIRGSSQTSGHVNVQLIPSLDRAIVEFRSIGHTTSQTRGYHSPIVIRSTGQTNFTATKRVEFTDPVFRVMPSTAAATTHTNIRSVRSQRGGLFSGLISKVGRRRAQQNKAQSERIASRHAETRIRNDFDEKLLEEIQGLRRTYRDDFRYPLKRQNVFPDFIRYSSTSQLASAEALQARSGQLASPSSPPPVPYANDLVVRLHQSAACNYATALLSGATLSDQGENEGARLDVPVPKWIKDLAEGIGGPFQQKGTSQQNETSDLPAPDGPTLAPADDTSEDKDHLTWSVKFRRGRPVSLDFSGNEVTIIIHSEQMIFGKGKPLRHWDIIFTYAMELSDGKLLLVRKDDVEFSPTSHDPESGKRARRGRFNERTFLNDQFNKLAAQGDGIPREILRDPITLTGELADVGTLWFRQATSNAGWLTIALDR